MHHLTPAHVESDEREASILWLSVKLINRRAGLDPHDPSVMVVEVESPDRAWRLDLIGQTLSGYAHTRPDLSTCFRVRAILEADVRVALRLDEPGAPTLADVPLASRAVPEFHNASAQIIEMDRSRRAGRSHQR